MSNPVYTFLVVPLVGWLVALSLALVGYLLMLKIREMRHNRRLDQERERLGLKRPCASMASWLL